MPLRRRLYVSLIAFLLILILSAGYRLANRAATSDLYFPFCGGRALLAGIDPYGGACVIEFEGTTYPPNPMTTILMVLPFTLLNSPAAGDAASEMIFWSLLTGVLVFGLLKDGQWWRLLLLTSASYWFAFLTLQWSPLIAAIAYLPMLVPLGLVKPHIALPVILNHLTWRRIAAGVLFVVLTLVLDPAWPFKWWTQASETYAGFIPLLTPIGFIVAVALLRWRQPRARLLCCMAVVPQRGLYDVLALWTIAESPRQILYLSACSWIGLAAGWAFPSLGLLALVASIYLAALPLLFLRGQSDRRPVQGAVASSL